MKVINYHLPEQRLELSLSEYRHQQPDSHNGSGKKEKDPNQGNSINEGRGFRYHNERGSNNQCRYEDGKRNAVGNPIMGDQHGFKTPVLNLKCELSLPDDLGDIEQLFWKLPEKSQQFGG